MNRYPLLAVAALLASPISAFAEGPGCGGGSVKVSLDAAKMAAESAIAAAPANLDAAKKAATPEQALAIEYIPGSCEAQKETFWDAVLTQLSKKQSEIRQYTEPKGDAEIVYAAKAMAVDIKEQMRLKVQIEAAANIIKDIRKDAARAAKKSAETGDEVKKRKQELFTLIKEPEAPKQDRDPRE